MKIHEYVPGYFNRDTVTYTIKNMIREKTCSRRHFGFYPNRHMQVMREAADCHDRN